MKHFFLIVISLCVSTLCFSQSASPTISTIFPSAFIDNAGQFQYADSNGTDTTAQVYFNSKGYHAFLNRTSTDFLFTSYDVRLDSAKRNPKFPDSTAVPIAMKKIRMEFEGANSHPAVSKYNSTGFASNYFTPNTGTGIVGALAYQNFLVNEIYNNVDVEYTSSEQNLKYKFIVHSGGDPSHIQILWRGVDSLRLDTAGNLLIYHSFGQMIDHTPIATQSGSSVSCSYIIINDSTFGFNIPTYSTSIDLIIDPLLTVNQGFAGNNPSWLVSGFSTDIDYDINTDAFYMTGYLNAVEFFNLTTNNNYTSFTLQPCTTCFFHPVSNHNLS